jgi:hypothetical protein
MAIRRAGKLLIKLGFAWYTTKRGLRDCKTRGKFLVSTTWGLRISRSEGRSVIYPQLCPQVVHRDFHGHPGARPQVVPNLVHESV